MARPPEEVDALRRGYVVERLPLEKAAKNAGIPPGTARKMKSRAAAKGDDWDKARAVSALTQAGSGVVAQMVLTDYLVVHQVTMAELAAATDLPPMDKAEAMSRMADAFTKTMSAVAKAAPDLGRYAVASEVMTDFAKFVQEQFPQHAAALVEVLEPFAAALADKYG